MQDSRHRAWGLGFQMGLGFGFRDGVLWGSYNDYAVTQKQSELLKLAIP